MDNKFAVVARNSEWDVDNYWDFWLFPSRGDAEEAAHEERDSFYNIVKVVDLIKEADTPEAKFVMSKIIEDTSPIAGVN